MLLAQRFDSKDVVVTAHRGYSSKYPENTILAFEKAIEVGVDIIEFDLRGTKDHVPVVLHDMTLDRTSSASGLPGDYTLSELKKFNFSLWVGPHDRNSRLQEPAYDYITIPTFEEVLLAIGNRVGLNIQIYEAHKPLLTEICRLYDKYDLYKQGYLSMSTYTDAREVRKINPDIELCVLEDQGSMDMPALKKQLDFGAKYIQPISCDITPELCKVAKNMGLYSSVFFSNTAQDNRNLISIGQQGILTDCPDILLNTIAELGLNNE